MALIAFQLFLHNFIICTYYLIKSFISQKMRRCFVYRSYTDADAAEVQGAKCISALVPVSLSLALAHPVLCRRCRSQSEMKTNNICMKTRQLNFKIHTPILRSALSLCRHRLQISQRIFRKKMAKFCFVPRSRLNGGSDGDNPILWQAKLWGRFSDAPDNAGQNLNNIKTKRRARKMAWPETKENAEQETANGGYCERNTS